MQTLLKIYANIRSLSLFLIFRSNFWIFLAFILAAVYLKFDFHSSPQAQRLFLFSQNIFENPFHNDPQNQWLLSSLLTPSLAYFLGFNQSLEAYLSMHVALLILGFLICTLKIRVQLGDLAARLFIIYLISSPAVFVLFDWLGTPDPITLFASVLLALYVKKPAISFSLGAIIALNHPEQSFFIFSLIVISETLQKETPPKNFLWPIAGLTFGFMLNKSYLSIMDFNITFDRFEYIHQKGLSRYIKSYFKNPIALIYSSLQFFWVFIFWGAWPNKTSRKKFLSILLIGLLITIIALDQTRVCLLLNFPALSLFFLKSVAKNHDADNDLRLPFAAILYLSFLLPHIYVWDGAIYTSIR